MSSFLVPSSRALGMFRRVASEAGLGDLLRFCWAAWIRPVPWPRNQRLPCLQIVSSCIPGHFCSFRLKSDGTCLEGKQSSLWPDWNHLICFSTLLLPGEALGVTRLSGVQSSHSIIDVRLNYSRLTCACSYLLCGAVFYGGAVAILI